MIAAAEEVEVVLDIPEDGGTVFGVTWAQDPREDVIFIKSFPTGANGERGLLESTGLVEAGDRLTAINGVTLARCELRDVMARIRTSKSPLVLRFKKGENSSCRRGEDSCMPGFSSLSRGYSRDVSDDMPALAKTVSGNEVAEGSTEPGINDDLDDVLNSSLLLGLAERVSEIQRRNSHLVRATTSIGRAAREKRAGVEGMAAAAVGLKSIGAMLPNALRSLKMARANASAICETMARLDESLTARERVVEARRKGLVGKSVSAETKGAVIA